MPTEAYALCPMPTEAYAHLSNVHLMLLRKAISMGCCHQSGIYRVKVLPKSYFSCLILPNALAAFGCGCLQTTNA